MFFTFGSDLRQMVYGFGDSQDDTVISASSVSVLGRISVRTDHLRRYIELSIGTGISVCTAT